MDNVQIGKVYRHFKGNYYFVENIGLDASSNDRLVIYKPLYNNKDSSIWVRKEEEFLEILPEREDNITKQKHRFELVDNLDKNYKLDI